MTRRLYIIIVLLIILIAALSVILLNKKITPLKNLTSSSLKWEVLYQNNTVEDTERIKLISFNRDEYAQIYLSPSDITGSTLIYMRKDENWLSGIGVRQQTKQTLKYIIGEVSNIEAIPGSSDLYVTLIDPFTKEILIKGRVSIDKSIYATDFREENVSDLQELRPLIEPIGISYALGPEKIRELIKEGDVITMQLTPSDVNDFSILKLDEKKYPLVTRIIIRRFKSHSEVK